MSESPQIAADAPRADVGAIATMFASIAFAITGQLLMKYGTRGAGGGGGLAGLGAALFSPFVLAGLGAFVVSSIMWLVVLSRLDLSYAFPMIALAQVALQVLSWALLGEHIPTLRVVGLAGICVGVICVGLSYGHRRPETAPAGGECEPTTD
jgi:drug/metabolite transporter (DMT)-like permease